MLLVIYSNYLYFYLLVRIIHLILVSTIRLSNHYTEKKLLIHKVYVKQNYVTNSSSNIFSIFKTL